MKIGIDARICDEGWYYGEYVCSLVEAFCEQRNDDKIVVYRSKNSPLSSKLSQLGKVQQKNTSLNRHSLLQDSKTRKLFESEKFGLMIFFDHHIPRGYKWDFYVLIESLKEVFFPKNRWFHRMIYTHKLEKALTKSKKVMVLDGGTALELNERLNIKEDLITRIPAFFPEQQYPNVPEIQTDIKAKHNIRGEYLIYDSWNEVHNNFERILRTIQKLKEKNIIIFMIILCDETTKDIDIRSSALDLWITEQIVFLGSVNSEIEASYYTQSSWVIFSSIYESFPFHFSKALHYGTPIFANDIPANKDAMWEDIHYLDPLSIYNMAEIIEQNTHWYPSKNSYQEIRENYNPQISSSRLSEIIDIKN